MQLLQPLSSTSVHRASQFPDRSRREKEIEQGRRRRKKATVDRREKERALNFDARCFPFFEVLISNVSLSLSLSSLCLSLSFSKSYLAAGAGSVDGRRHDVFRGVEKDY